ncbi:flagellar protein FlbB [Spirochaetia bacterium]|nr:flagellar protein FlbB [Spirochaetia bacterium]
MARFRVGRIIGRIVVLLLLIVILAGGGIVWFDYLNVIDAKTVLAPLYRLIGREGRTQGELGPDDFLNLDAERLAMRLEALDLRNMELDQKESEIAAKMGESEQMAQELEERQKALEEQQKSINDAIEDADIITRNVEQQARYLTGMTPQRAVAIMTEMNDQQAIDVLRMTEDIAQREGTSSMVAFWLSLMPPQRAAELQRKMAGRPSSLN